MTHRRPSLLTAIVLLLGLVVMSAPNPVVRADGTPDVSLSASMLADTLYGEDIPVSLRLENTTLTDAYNASFNDTLPAGVSYVVGSSAPFPDPVVLPQGDGTTVLVWSNVADSLAGTVVELDYTARTDNGVWDAGDVVANTANVYVHSNPRFLPRFDPVTGAVEPTSFTGNAAATAQTELIPFRLTKEEPNTEAELLRGVHDHKTVYTLTVENNRVNPTDDFSIVDYLPANLEFLGCGGVDNSAGGTSEYDGRRITDTADPAVPLCIVPSDVTTVTTDPDGADPMPNDVYTRVEWDTATLAAGLVGPGAGDGDLLASETFVLEYIAAIPLYENVDGVLGVGDEHTANLDNNTGALTTETESSAINWAQATGTYDPAGANSIETDDDTEQVVVEDVSIHKSVDDDHVDQFDLNTWTLLIESSEYTTATGTITVTDTIPSSLDVLSTSPLATTTTPGPAGTIILTWDLPGFVAPNSSTAITIDTEVREDYRSTTDPVSVNDAWTNTVDLATVGTIITAVGPVATSPVALVDESSAGQFTSGVTILKEVSDQVAGTLTCGDGSGIAPGDWSDDVADGNYRPGDRVCWRLSVFYPSELDTQNPTVRDFLPAGFTFESQQQGANGDITPTSFDASAAPTLTWALPDVDIGGLTFEAVVSTVYDQPDAAASGDLLENLMKFSFENTAGDVFQLRDDADAPYIEPELTLDKSASPAAGTGGDVITYTVATTNSGDLDALNTSVRDVLPPGIDCDDVTDKGGATCTDGAPSDQLQWPVFDVTVGATVNRTYEVTLPDTFSPGATLDNTAGVREYQNLTNNTDHPGQLFTLVPSNNIDPTQPAANTGPADDDASVTINQASIAKARTTSITEPGNADDRATIGERIDYTVTATIPDGTTVDNAQVRDVIPPETTLVAAPTFQLDGGALPAGFIGSESGGTITLNFPTSYTVPASDGDKVFTIEFSVRVDDTSENLRVDDSGTGDREDRIRNVGRLQWDDGNLASTVDTFIVEPNIVLDKTNDGGPVIQAGQTYDYTVTVRNDDGPANVSRAHDIVVVDNVPPELIVNGASISNGGVLTPGATASDPDTITWNIAALDPGASIDLTYEVTSVDPLIAAGVLVNNANAAATSRAGSPTLPEFERTSSSAAGGPGSGYQDPASDSVSVPVFAITKSGTPNSATVGETVAYTLGVTIPGGVIAYDATVIDQLPAGITFESLTSITCVQNGGACSPDLDTGSATVIPGSGHGSGDDVAFFFDDLTTAATENRVLTITYDAFVADVAAANAPGSLVNTARVRWNDSDLIPSAPSTVGGLGTFDNASSPATDTVSTVEPTLTVDKDVAGQNLDDDTRRAKPGEVLSYTVRVANTGNGAAHDVIVTDVATDASWAFSDTTVAPGVTNTDADPAGGLEWTIDGPIPPAGFVDITYTLTVPPGYDSGDEIPAGPEQTNTADVPSYFGVPSGTRAVHPTRSFREYDDVTPDVVTIELDLASIGDFVWFDVDGDGGFDAGEPPLGGVDVTVTYLGLDGVLGGTDDESVTVPTDASGLYVVDQLPGGMYVVDVLETDPDFVGGLAPSYDLDGTTISPNGTWTGALGEDEDKRDVDFGYTGTGSIGDLIWFDQDGDGVQDAGEDGLGGIRVTVTWLGPDNVIGGGDDIDYLVTTDDDGRYLADELPAGGYVVTVTAADVPAGMSVVTDPQGALDGSSALILGAGASNLDQDFGYRGAGAIGDTIWLDQNGDGTQDGAEPGLAGVTVQVISYGPDGVLGGVDDSTFTTVTGASGDYLVEYLPPGNYQVDVLGGLPAMVVNTGDPDGGNDSSSQTTLTAGDPVDLDQDFGYDADSVLGDRVWWDLDRDGVQDVNEVGLAGVEVTAAGPNGLSFTTTTNTTGDYLFTDIPDGDWTVTVTGGVPAGFTPTFDADGSFDETSDVTLATEDLFQDFGYAGDSSIGDRLWLDLDEDGVQDAGEPGIESIDVELTWAGPNGTLGDGDDVVVVTETSSTGAYLFPGLPAGDFSVAVDGSDPDFPTAVTPTYDRDDGLASPDGVTPVTLGLSEDVADVDFGYVGAGRIGDTVWLDRNGDGVVDPDEPGLGLVDVTLEWFGEDGDPSTSADNETFTTTTDAGGNYLFDGLPDGSFGVSVDTGDLPPEVDATFDADGGLDSTSLVTLALGESDLDQDFGYRGAGAIGDTVFVDLDGDGSQGPTEPGIPGQTVELTWAGPTGPESFTTTTDADGTYRFDFLPDGDYTVAVVGGIALVATNTADPDGATANEADVTLAARATDLDQDFGYQGENSIGDTVWHDVDADGADDAGEPRLAAVDVVLVWFGPDGAAGGGDDVTLPTVTTDVDGQYLFGGLPDGTYEVEVVGGLPTGLDTITFDDDDGATSPDGTSVVVDLGVGTTGPVADLDQDFGYTGAGRIGDTIWLDQNGDGAVDAGEPGIPGAVVTVTWAGLDGTFGTADDVVYAPLTTGSDGTYLAEHLPAGEFRVGVTNLPPGISPSADPDGGDDDMSQVMLAAGEERLDQDFGYVGGASIGDTIWLDLDGDGEQNGDEPGLPGITVTVTAAGADGVLDTGDDIVVIIETDDDGRYLANGLPPGETSVSYGPSDLATSLVPDTDLDGGDATTTVVTLANGDDRRDVDFGVVGDATITGTVWVDIDGDGVLDAGEEGIPDVTVEVTWDGPDGPIVLSVVTDENGDWALSDIPAGDYAVSVVVSTVPDRFVASTPTDVGVTVPPGGTANAENGFVPAGSIGDRVWLDVDLDRAQDPTEFGASGVTVVLLDENGDVIASTVTDADGRYVFADLPPGEYTVRLDPDTIPDGSVVVADPSGPLDGVHTVDLDPGQDIDTVDFGIGTRDIATTGASIANTLAIATAAFLVGLLLLTFRRRRYAT